MGVALPADPLASVGACARPRVSARGWLALAAGAGCAAWALAGLYPRFDGGELRVVLALTSGPFAAAVVAAALGAPSRFRAGVRAVVLSALLGVASTIVPAAVLAWGQGGSFFGMCVFGMIFGSITGAIYGLPLAVLCTLGHRFVDVETESAWDSLRSMPAEEAVDGAARLAGVWLVCASLVPCVVMLPAVLSELGALAGAVIAARAHVRLRSRASWVERVRSSLEPGFRVRLGDVRDPAVGGDEVSVLEWCPDELPETAGTAYRVAASGRAIAIVSRNE